MQIIAANQAKVLKFVDHAITEFSFDDQELSLAIAELNGDKVICAAETEKPFAVNKVCKELIYILAGEGKIVFEHKTFEFKVGDALLILPGEKYYWQGQFKAATFSTPAWSAEQHQAVD